MIFNAFQLSLHKIERFFFEDVNIQRIVIIQNIIYYIYYDEHSMIFEIVRNNDTCVRSFN